MLKKIQEYFEIDQRYQFEWGDIRALLTVLNVIGIVWWGIWGAAIGLFLSFWAVMQAIDKDRRINGIIIGLALIALNLYFLVNSL